jgi:hypothetical protein
MGFIILKELLPSLEGTAEYNEELAYIHKSSLIDNDETFLYDTLVEAENKRDELLSDVRYEGRRLIIKQLD